MTYALLCDGCGNKIEDDQPHAELNVSTPAAAGASADTAQRHYHAESTVAGEPSCWERVRDAGAAAEAEIRSAQGMLV